MSELAENHLRVADNTSHVAAVRRSVVNISSADARTKHDDADCCAPTAQATLARKIAPAQQATLGLDAIVTIQMKPIGEHDIAEQTV